jgi:hypothetical protein
MYRLASDCARDEVVRKFAASALGLVMLDKALRGDFDREEALLRFGEMYATAVAGDGTVGPREVELAVGGELGGGAALLRLAALHLFNQLLPKGLKFSARIYAERGRYYRIAATGEDAARFMRLLAVSAPSAGGEYLSPKFDEFVEEARVEVRLDENSIRRTEGRLVAADLIISEGGAAVKYNVYLRDDILLQFVSTDRNRVELAARLLKLAGVNTEVKKEGGKDVWYVVATTDMLAAGRKELRDAVRKVVEEALENGWVDEKKARRWLKKLERGLTLMEGWPKYHVRLTRDGALEVSYRSTNFDSIQQVARQLNEIGLVEGRHFTVKTPEGGQAGYVRILKKGLAYAAWLSVYGEEEQQRRLAAKFVEYILQRAEDAGKNVRKKAEEIVEKGISRSSQTLKDFDKEVEVNGEKYKVKVIGWGAELEKSRSGKKLLKIRITAEINNVKSDYTITYSRYSRNSAAVGHAYARASAPGGREADAERYSALIKALTGKEPRVYRMKDGEIIIECGREHLDGFMSYTELADAIEEWLEETSRRRPTH